MGFTVVFTSSNLWSHSLYRSYEDGDDVQGTRQRVRVTVIPVLSRPPETVISFLQREFAKEVVVADFKVLGEFSFDLRGNFHLTPMDSLIEHSDCKSRRLADLSLHGLLPFVSPSLPGRLMSVPAR